MVLGLLARVVAAVEEEGALLRAEFYRPDGPRGRGGSAPIDEEMERRLRAKLLAWLDCAYVGEETGSAPGAERGWVWLIDPHDGTTEFLQGRRGSAISVGLIKDGVPVLGVVHCPFPPDRGPDTIAWAEGGALQRNGKPVKTSLAGRKLAPGELGWATASTALRPETYSRAFFPARYVAMPSVAYRLARIAAGDGVATVSTHSVNEYDIAAGAALLRGVGGVVLDAQGKPIVFSGDPDARVTGAFAGAPEAAAALAKFDWRALEGEPRRTPRVSLGFPRKDFDTTLSRAQGCLLGQVIGDSLGSRVEGKGAAWIAEHHAKGVRELADGGMHHLIAGQPTDDSEMALTLARTLVRDRTFEREKILDAYRDWMTTRPVDIGATTERGLLGLHTTESESNGSLMRVSPLGIWAAGDPARAADAARKDSALTHPNPVCVEACAGFVAAIAAGVAGASREEMLKVALQNSQGRAKEVIQKGTPPENFEKQAGSVLTALQNAFYCLASKETPEELLIATIGRGGDTDTNAAIAGALLGAAHGRAVWPSRWIYAVLACRSLAEGGALRPRPPACWPDDVLDLAEALLVAAKP